MTSMLEAAMTWWDAGCSVVPACQDGSKRPLGDWKNYQTLRAGREDVRHWYHNGQRTGVGLVCGKVSGNLEMLELEGRATSPDDIDAIIAECGKLGIEDLWSSLVNDGYAEWTPSAGIHFLYRISDHDVPGNVKVARRPATQEELAENPDDKHKVLAETRGEGGYVIVAPSSGAVHPSGDTWSVLAGRIGVIPTITWAQRNLLHKAIHQALDKMPAAAPVVASKPSLSLSLNATRPGDDFQLRATWQEILEPHGWTALRMTAGTTYWLRPGKKFQGAQVHSATTGHAGVGADDRLYVFSSSTPFNPEQPYNKFHAYAVLNHNGDFASAAKELGRLGYGTPRDVDSDSQLVFASVKTATGPAVAAQTPSQPAAMEPVPVDTWRKSYSRPKLTPQDVLAESFDMHGAGNLYAKAYDGAFRYCGFQKAWHFWDGQLWRRDQNSRFEDASKALLDIMKVAAHEATLAEEPFAKKLATHVSKMANMPSPNIPRWALSDERIATEADAFDSIDKLVTLANGVYDLESHTLMPHDPSLLMTKQMPVAFDKDATCPGWEKFLSEVLPDVEVREYLQRAIGHALLGKAEQRALFLLHGKSGCGKSQFIRVIEQLFGDFAETATPQTFNGASKTASITNDLNDLKGKRFVTVSELDEGETFNEALVKRLTGGDTAKSRALWQENTKWRVKFGLFMATNHLPRLTSDDDAIWRRVKPVHFPTIVKNTGTEVLDLGNKLFAAEAAGILNWVLNGVRAYQERGLDDLPQITAAVDTYRKDVDVVAQFASQGAEEGYFEVGEGLEIQSTALHNLFTSWCNANGIKGVLSLRRFSIRLERTGFHKKKTSSANFFTGIGPGRRGFSGTLFPARM